MGRSNLGIRTHRERRAKYLQGLETELAHLRSRNAEHTTQLRQMATVNQRLRALLLSNGIQIPSDLDFVDPASFNTAFEILEHDEGVQSLQPLRPESGVALKGTVDLTDPQTAIDFILALEEPCLAHQHDHVGPDGETGHSMLLQSSVLQYAPATTTTSLGRQLSPGSTWNVPRVQLEEQLNSLLNTSLKLNLKGEMTPVMCWNRVQEHHKRTPILVAQFQHLRKALVHDVLCYG